MVDARDQFCLPRAFDLLGRDSACHKSLAAVTPSNAGADLNSRRQAADYRDFHAVHTKN